MHMGLAFLVCGNLQVALWLHTTEDPVDDQWAAALARIADLKNQKKGDISNFRMLVLTDGGAPNASQRGQLFTDLLGGKTKSAAVSNVLSNRLKRGIATAVTWLNPSFKVYAPEQFLAALTYLDIADYAPQVLVALRQLQLKVSPCKTLESLSAAQPT